MRLNQVARKTSWQDLFSEVSWRGIADFWTSDILTQFQISIEKSAGARGAS